MDDQSGTFQVFSLLLNHQTSLIEDSISFPEQFCKKIWPPQPPLTFGDLNFKFGNSSNKRGKVKTFWGFQQSTEKNSFLPNSTSAEESSYSILLLDSFQPLARSNNFTMFWEYQLWEYLRKTNQLIFHQHCLIFIYIMNLVNMIMILDCNSTSPVEVDLGTDKRVSTPQKAGRSVSPTHLTFTD